MRQQQLADRAVAAGQQAQHLDLDGRRQPRPAVLGRNHDAQQARLGNLSQLRQQGGSGTLALGAARGKLACQRLGGGQGLLRRAQQSGSGGWIDVGDGHGGRRYDGRNARPRFATSTNIFRPRTAGEYRGGVRPDSPRSPHDRSDTRLHQGFPGCRRAGRIVTAPSSPVVDTGYGPVRGSDDGTARAVAGYFRYAAAPVGELRWRSPQPPARSAGDRRRDRIGAGVPADHRSEAPARPRRASGRRQPGAQRLGAERNRGRRRQTGHRCGFTAVPMSWGREVSRSTTGLSWPPRVMPWWSRSTTGSARSGFLDLSQFNGRPGAKGLRFDTSLGLRDVLSAIALGTRQHLPHSVATRNR